MILLITLINLILLVTFAHIERRRVGFYFSLPFLFLLFHQLYFCYYPVLGLVVRGETDVFDIYALSLALIAALFFLLGGSFINTYFKGGLNVIYGKSNNAKAFNFLFFCSLALLLFFIKQDFTSLGTYFLSSYASKIEGETLFFELSILLFAVCTSILIIKLLLLGKFKIATTILLISGIILIVIGKRMPIAIFSFPYLYLVVERELVNRKFVYFFSLFSLFFLVNIYGYYRTYLIPILLGVSEVSVTEIWKQVDFTHSEFSAQYENLRIIFSSQGKYYLLGESLIRAFLFLIPSAFISRGETLSAQFAREHFPELFAIGGGMGFSILSEFYVNFGYFAPLGYFFLGLSIFTISRIFETSLNVKKYYFYLPLFSTLSLTIHRTEFAAVIKNIEVLLVFSLFCLLFVSAINLQNWKRKT